MAEHIATSPLTGRIHAGRVNKAGTAFVGEKRDVTSDVLRAVIEKAEFHGGQFDIEGGGRKWLVTVAEVTDGVSVARPEGSEPSPTDGSNK